MRQMSRPSQKKWKGMYFYLFFVYIGKVKHTTLLKVPCFCICPFSRLKYRMQDLRKPLKTVNRSLWEEVNHFTEKEVLKNESRLFHESDSELPQFNQVYVCV